MSTYVCPSVPNLTTWIDVPFGDEGEVIPTRVDFEHGQLILEDEAEIAAFESLFSHPKCQIKSIVRKLDKEAAEAFAREFKKTRNDAIRGQTTSASMAGIREGVEQNAIAKMRADGVPEDQINTLADQLAAEESLLVTEDSKSPEPPIPVSKIPSLNPRIPSLNPAK